MGYCGFFFKYGEGGLNKPCVNCLQAYCHLKEWLKTQISEIIGLTALTTVTSMTTQISITIHELNSAITQISYIINAKTYITYMYKAIEISDSN